MTSLTGLQSGNFTDIDVLYSIGLDGDTGQNNQVIKSDGTNSSWGDVSGLISFNRLNADGSTITIGGSLSGHYDTSAAKTIAVAKVPNALTAGTNVSFSSGSTYDGSSAITINTTDTDTTYQGSTTINIDTATNPDTINCIKVPNALTAGTNVSFSSGTTFDGSSAITISSTDTNTEYTAGDGISIGGTTIETKIDEDTIDYNGSAEMEVIKVPNSLSAGTNLSYTSGSTFDGAAARTINLATNPTNLNLTDSTNVIHPPNVFDVAGDLRMTIEMGNFYPNDDSSYFNIGVEDDFSAKIHGTLKVLTSALEVCGYFVIPANYTATGVRIDATNSSGAAVSRTIMCASITTYGATGYTSLNFSGNTNAEFALSPTMAGASDKIMLITIFTTSTSDHIRGGYIKLTR